MKLLGFSGTFLLACTLLSMAAGESEGEWQIKTLSAVLLDRDEIVVSPDLGELRLPELPGKDAGDKEVLDFLTKNNQVMQAWFESKGAKLAEGTLVVVEPRSATVVVRGRGEGLDLVENIVSQAAGDSPDETRADLTIVEAPKPVVDAAALKAQALDDHAALLEGLLKEKGARVMNILSGVTRSGQRAQIESGKTRNFAVGEFSIDGEGRVEYPAMEERFVGTSLEWEPTMDAAGANVDVRYTVEHHFHAPTTARQPVCRIGAQVMELETTRFHRAKINGNATFSDGGTSFLGSWSPQLDGGAVEVLQAAFLGVSAPRVLPVPDMRLEVWLREVGEKVVPLPKDGTRDERLPEGMVLVRFRVSPAALTNPPEDDYGASDAFAAAPSNEPQFTIKATVKQYLESMGVPFPKGASANYDKTNQVLTVVNTPEAADMIGAIFERTSKREPVRNVNIVASVVEMPVGELRELMARAAAKGDHSQEWGMVEQAIEKGDASLRDRLWARTKSGMKASQEAGHEGEVVASVTLGSQASAVAGKGDEKSTGPKAEARASVSTGESSTFIETVGTESGISLEVEPVVGSSGQYLDLAVALEVTGSTEGLRLGDVAPGSLVVSAPGSEGGSAVIRTQATFLNGVPKLLGTLQLDGGEGDIWAAVFVTATTTKVGGGE